jgi:rhodanese-related sulfurtransferase
MGAKRTSTIGYEKLYNAALQIGTVEEFIKSLTTNMPAAPDHFSRCSAINGRGPSLVRELPVPEPLTPMMFQKMMEKDNTVVLDIRDFASFGGLHVPGSYHIDFGGNFATFAAWILPPDADILLVSENAQQAADAVDWLRRVGLDSVKGYLEGGMFEWGKSGLKMEHVHQLSTFELHDKITQTEKMTLVDVRAPKEFEAGHIEGAINIPVPDLRTRYTELDPNLMHVLICATGHRSSLGSSLLKQQGFKQIYNAAGGMTAYSASGFAPECPICVGPHGPEFLGK